MRRITWLTVALSMLGLASPLLADGPADNVPEKVRRVPKPGIKVSREDRAELDSMASMLDGMIDSLKGTSKGKPADLIPDVEIYAKAIRDALDHEEFFEPKDVEKAKGLFKEGRDRADQLRQGSPRWTQDNGMVVRGYRSKIDGSVQPYGLVIPSSYRPDGPQRSRLDVWFHGRGENLSEVNFLDEHRRSRGEFTPEDTIVLHPYGRYCNAFKFAGEVDVLEAIEAVRRQYRIDDDRISVRGFSMGGAACWQFAVHQTDQWFAAAPGAGFSETPRFLKVFQKETLTPTWYERKLWRLYDCTDYAVNLLNLPTVAYSGELDIQKQAADVMAEALKAEGIELTHLIGPKTQHSYHPATKLELNRRIDSIAAKGRSRLPLAVDLATYTLKYNRMYWVTIDALGEHWERAEVRAKIDGKSAVAVKTRNVTDLTLDMPAGWCPMDIERPVALTIDGKQVEAPRPGSDRSWTCSLHHDGKDWQVGRRAASGDDATRKRHDLQGPIDDAFMDSFVFVRATGNGANAKVEAWAESERKRAVDRWRVQFRGKARVKDDTDMADADIAGSNLILWGTPSSNAVLKRIADKLPIRWDDGEIRAGDRSFRSDDHALILICPNPLNPNRYVVLNSGFTYREYDDLNNARQVPKLPDWAVVDTRTPPGPRYPGKVVDADFFDETWKLRPKRDLK